MKEKYAYSICGEIYYLKRYIRFSDKEDSKFAIYVEMMVQFLQRQKLT